MNSEECIALNSSCTRVDIADEMGFSTIQFFSRYVKKITGLSPTDYRRSKGL
ncbi:MAG: AraC family transcriptional regulator [Bacteroidales bacterium]|nr:AraC family transcriptional regulator [Bacteroidales bacterium]